MSNVVQKKDYRTRVERTNYFKKAYISLTSMWELKTKASNWVLFFYLILLPIFLYLVFLETKDISLMFKVPALYLWVLIYWVGLYLLMRWKTTLRGVRRIYEIIGDYLVIMYDNNTSNYNTKNKFTINELKEIKIKIW